MCGELSITFLARMIGFLTVGSYQALPPILCAFPLLPPPVCRKIIVLYPFHISLIRKLFSTQTGEEDVWRTFHHFSGQDDWIPDRGKAGQRARLHRSSIHNGGIQFMLSLTCKNRSPACIINRFIFQ